MRGVCPQCNVAKTSHGIMVAFDKLGPHAQRTVGTKRVDSMTRSLCVACADALYEELTARFGEKLR